MSMSPPILMASSLRAESDRVLGRALQLASQLQSGVTLLHVLEETEADRTQLRLRTLLKRDLGDLATKIDVRFEAGSAPAMIARIAEEIDAPLIVVGAPRFNSAGDYILGTAVDYLVRRAPVPVLIARRRALAPYRQIVVATDFSSCSQIALEAADDFFPEAQITLLHVYQPAYGALLDRNATARFVREEAEREMSELLFELETGLRDRITPLIEEGDLDSIVTDQFLTGSFDLLVLGTHGRGGFVHAMIGSRASALLSNSPSDVMMVRETM